MSTASWVKMMNHAGNVLCYCEICGDQVYVATQQDINAFVHRHNEHFAQPGWVGAGDVVKKAASAMGIETCAPCEKRRRRMNQWFPRLWKR